MKKYVFFCFSTRVGGGQSYVNQKIEYLLKNSWLPIVFTAYEKAVDEKKIVWRNIGKLEHYYCECLIKSPEFWSKKKILSTLDWMSSIIDRHEDDKIIVESHTSYFAEWGEMLAERNHARNFCFILDEVYDNYGASGLLYFKFLRGELAVIHKDYVNVLLKKYTQIDNPQEYRLGACPTKPVEDVDTDINSCVGQFDINILYLGRYKQYCEEIKKGIRKFALRHSKKKIQFLIIGEIRNMEVLADITNLSINKIGFINPIPRKLFKGINVGIAGSGSASTIAREGVPTIIANPTSFFASGILGYTVFDTLSTEANYKYEDLMDDILFNNCLDGKTFNFPQSSDSDKVLSTHFEFLERADTDFKYFDLGRNPQNNFSNREKIGYYMRRYFKVLYDILIKVDKKNPFRRG